MDEYSSVYQIPVFQYVLEFFRKLIDLSIYQIFTHAHTIEIFDDSELLYRNASILLKVTIIHFLPPPPSPLFLTFTRSKRHLPICKSWVRNPVSHLHCNKLYSNFVVFKNLKTMIIKLIRSFILTYLNVSNFPLIRSACACFNSTSEKRISSGTQFASNELPELLSTVLSKQTSFQRICHIVTNYCMAPMCILN